MVPSRSEKTRSRLRKALASTHGPTRTTGVPMFKSILVLVLFLVSSIALAQAAAIPKDAEIAAAKAACEKKYDANVAPSSLKVSIALAQEKCKLEVDVKVLQLKAQASGVKNDRIEAELAHQRAALDAIAKSLRALESAPKADAKKPPVDAAPSMPAATMPPAMTGAPFTVVEAPGQLVASTKEIPELTSRIRIHSFMRGAQRWLGDNVTEVRVVIIKDGEVLAVSNPSRPGVFTEFYADLNGDGKPDAMSYKGFDPSFLDTVYVATETGSQIQLVFLVPLGNKKVAVSGLPLQTLWGHPVRIKIDRIRGMGLFNTSAYEGMRSN